MGDEAMSAEDDEALRNGKGGTSAPFSRAVLLSFLMFQGPKMILCKYGGIEDSGMNICELRIPILRTA